VGGGGGWGSRRIGGDCGGRRGGADAGPKKLGSLRVVWPAGSEGLGGFENFERDAMWGRRGEEDDTRGRGGLGLGLGGARGGVEVRGVRLGSEAKEAERRGQPGGGRRFSRGDLDPGRARLLLNAPVFVFGSFGFGLGKVLLVTCVWVCHVRTSMQPVYSRKKRFADALLLHQFLFLLARVELNKVVARADCYYKYVEHS
jgi:hypothetical protein